MKKLVLTLTVMMLCAGLASAQISKPISFFAGGGVGIVQGDASSLYKTGYHAMGGVGYSVAPMVQFVGKVEYHKFGADLGISIPGYNADWGQMMFGGAAKLTPSLPSFPIKVYGLAGLGMASVNFPDRPVYNLATATFDYVEIPNESKMYFELGVGAELGSTPAFSFFAQARYVSTSMDGGSFNYIPVTLGIKF